MVMTLKDGIGLAVEKMINRLAIIPARSGSKE